MLRTEEFWDAVNFARGARPAKLRPAPLSGEEAYRARLRAFEEFVAFVAKHEGARVITYRELPSIYRDPVVELSRDDLGALAKKLLERPSFHVIGDKPVSLADAFYALSFSLKAFREGDALPQKVTPPLILGPLEEPAELEESFRVRVKDVVDAAAHAYGELDRNRAIPSSIAVGGKEVGPLSFLLAMARAYLMLVNGDVGRVEVPALGELLDFEDYNFKSRVASQWSWVIFPEGFYSRNILRLTLLQLWTLKLAIMKC
ncbi:MAG: hypothetical protein DRK00_09740 [Thermoprotei archaeon]|nr:MAG: hypothetical protein DRK00_09740 [Thermoprotei archaeon]